LKCSAIEVEKSWPVPKKTETCLGECGPMYFDLYENEWRFKNIGEDHLERGDDLARGRDTDNRTGTRNNVDEGGEYEDDNKSSGSLEDEDDYEDTLLEGTTVDSRDEGHDAWHTRAGHLDWSQGIGSSGGTKVKAEQPSLVSRTIISISDMSLYSCISGPTSMTFLQHARMSTNASKNARFDGERRFLEVVPDRPVYSIHSEKKPTSLSSMKWRQLTRSPVSGLVLIDSSLDKTRVLVSEPEDFNCFDVEMSMAEFYLVLSVYFDNFFEDAYPQFISARKASPVATNRMALENWAEYGTEAFCRFVRTTFCSWEFYLARSLARLRVGMEEAGHFPGDIFSLIYLGPTSSQRPQQAQNFAEWSEWKHVVHPFASILLLRSTLHMMGGGEVLQIAVGSGGVQLRDTRLPCSTVFPVALSAMPEDAPILNLNEEHSIEMKTTVQSFADFDFGLRHGPSCLDCNINQPVKVTCFVTNSNWVLTNVGVEQVDLNLKTLELAWLLSDYFSLYFRRPEFGHPGISYDLNMLSDWPYGGTDTRVFVFRPHVTVPENPLIDRSPIVMMESNAGVYYRYMFDSDHSVVTECHVLDLVIVLLKNYRPPSESRGIRGTSGSGRGVRTILENLTVTYNSQFNHGTTQTDTFLKFYGRNAPKAKYHVGDMDSNDSAGDEQDYQSLDLESLQLSPVNILEPKCVYPLDDLERDFQNFACVASSLEDLLFAVLLISHLMGYDYAAPTARPREARK